MDIESPMTSTFFSVGEGGAAAPGVPEQRDAPKSAPVAAATQEKTACRSFGSEALPCSGTQEHTDGQDWKLLQIVAFRCGEQPQPLKLNALGAHEACAGQRVSTAAAACKCSAT